MEQNTCSFRATQAVPTGWPTVHVSPALDGSLGRQQRNEVFVRECGLASQPRGVRVSSPRKREVNNKGPDERTRIGETAIFSCGRSQSASLLEEESSCSTNSALEQGVTSTETELSALFSTILESNALLREEVANLGQGGDARGSAVWASPVGAMKQDSAARTTRMDMNQSHQMMDALSRSVPAVFRPTPDGTASFNSSLYSREAMSIDDLEPSGHDLQREGYNMNAGFRTDMQASTQISHRSHDLPTLTNSTEDRAITIRGSDSDPLSVSGAVTIEQMWNGFSVEEYNPMDRLKARKVKVPSEKVHRPVQKAWCPQVTIPEPFFMTLREAHKPNKKAIAQRSAEQERLEKELQEELECKKKFRAHPVPASTYISLHQLRSGDYRMKSKSTSTKPFSFMQREEEKRQQKLQALREKLKKDSDMRVFKAKPLPMDILSSEMSERIKEKEEYRKLCIKMRSQEMLASSHLPKSMQLKGREYTVGSLRRQRMNDRQGHAFLTKEHTFHPKINPVVPDFDKHYSEFQQQLSERKRIRPPTYLEPFPFQMSLPTEKIKREDSKSSVSSSNSLVDKPNSIIPVLPVEPSYPIQMTKTTKLRQSMSQKNLAEEVEKEAIVAELKKARKEEEKDIQKKVLQKVQFYDHTAWLQEKTKEKLQELRFVVHLYHCRIF